MAANTPHSTLPKKWLRVVIPTALIIIWVAIAGIGGPYFGRIEEVSSVDLTSFLPASAESTKVQNEIKNFRPEGVLPAFTVFKANDGIIDANDTVAIKNATQEFIQLEGVKGSISPPIVSEDKKAAFVTTSIDSESDIQTVVSAMRTTLEKENLPQIEYFVSGAAGFSRDLNVAFSGIDGLLLLVAFAVVFVILVAVYRSPLLPLLVLMTSVFALAASILIVWLLAKQGIVELNGQVQGILFILVIGAATDYSLLYVSRYREELHMNQTTWRANVAALKASIEPILASGGTVIVGLLCLLFSDLASNKGLGPIGSIGVAMAMLSTLTFLPAVLQMFGRVSFWPLRPQYEKTDAKAYIANKKGVWSKVANIVSTYPRPIWISTLVILSVVATGIFQLRADGVPQSDLILGYSEAREGQNVLNDHFPNGSGSPSLIIGPAQKQEELVAAIKPVKGVSSIAATSDDSPSGLKPLSGFSATELAIFDRATVKSVNERILLNVTLDASPDSPAAETAIVDIRNAVHKVDKSSIVGGVTATSLDTNTTSIRDRAVIIPIVLGAITLILMILLRSVLAPILLLLTTLISFGTSLGVAALLFNNVFNFSGADPSVVLYAFVFLVALGIDYNIFLMTRVREESVKHGTREGVLRGLIVTGGVITSAGVVLAATFAALAVIPILFLGQLAFIVAFGVLLDTVIVRSLLVPALIHDIGPKIWWPSKLSRSKQ